ncbi:MAG: hypothetical protein JWO71_2988 [Candidatus Acidoferrum typicum]|nr:hypothetical protein [Candidatus Acidoferrum typicum]
MTSGSNGTGRFFLMVIYTRGSLVESDWSEMLS